MNAMPGDIIQKLLLQSEQESKCMRRRVGAVLVSRDGRIEAAYNGNTENPCVKGECIRNRLQIEPGTAHSLCLGIHAEMRLLLTCLENGTEIEDAMIFCSYSPCVDCATILARYKIHGFFFQNEYADKKFLDIFKAANITCGRFKIL
ncbi:MAG: hypothetical protein LUG99_14990 [Lachnospiraceae bacterium]|nr:hypothetical protein [Lachnospiraceae bacterium]